MTPEAFIAHLTGLAPELMSSDTPHAEFVATIAQDADNIHDLAAACSGDLSPLMASSVLGWLYDARPECFDPASTLSWFPRGRDIGAANALSQFLISRGIFSPDDMLDRLLDLIRTTTDENLLNLYSYACWGIINGRSIRASDGKTTGCLINVDWDALNHVRDLSHLPDYARNTLAECKP